MVHELWQSLLLSARFGGMELQNSLEQPFPQDTIELLERPVQDFGDIKIDFGDSFKSCDVESFNQPFPQETLQHPMQDFGDNKNDPNIASKRTQDPFEQSSTIELPRQQESSDRNNNNDGILNYNIPSRQLDRLSFLRLDSSRIHALKKL